MWGSRGILPHGDPLIWVNLTATAHAAYPIQRSSTQAKAMSPAVATRSWEGLLTTSGLGYRIFHHVITDAHHAAMVEFGHTEGDW